MNYKKPQPLSERHRCSTAFPLCRNCRTLQRRIPNTRQPAKASVAARDLATKQQVVSAMYAYLMTSWEELPEHNKRALGFDFIVGSEGEEAALNVARLFMEYADVSFRRALAARRRRLGVD